MGSCVFRDKPNATNGLSYPTIDFLEWVLVWVA